MNITVFLEYYPPFQGSDRAIFELTQHLDKSKIKIKYVVIPPLRALWELNQKMYNSKRLEHLFNVSKKSLKGINRIILPSSILKLWKKNLYFSYIITFFYLLFRLIKLKKQIDSEINLLNHPSPLSGLLSFLFLKIFRKKIVMGSPDLIASYGIDVMGEKTSNFKDKGLTFLENVLLKHSYKIITINDYIKDYLIKIGIKRGKIQIIPNGVDADIFNPTIDTEKIIKKFDLGNFFKVIYIGHIEKWAGIYEIIDAAQKIYKIYPEIQFLMIGDGIEREKLEKMNFQANIKFLGLQPYNLIPFFIKSSDIAVITFPNTKTTHATSPIKVFEYMSMEKPIISTYIHGIKDVIHSYKNGIFIYRYNSDELVKKIVELFENKELRQNLGNEARKTILSKYTWNLISKEFEKLCALITN